MILVNLEYSLRAQLLLGGLEHSRATHYVEAPTPYIPLTSQYLTPPRSWIISETCTSLTLPEWRPALSLPSLNLQPPNLRRYETATRLD